MNFTNFRNISVKNAVIPIWYRTFNSLQSRTWNLKARLKNCFGKSHTKKKSHFSDLSSENPQFVQSDFQVPESQTQQNSIDFSVSAAFLGVCYCCFSPLFFCSFLLLWIWVDIWNLLCLIERGWQHLFFSPEPCFEIKSLSIKSTFTVCSDLLALSTMWLCHLR